MMGEDTEAAVAGAIRTPRAASPNRWFRSLCFVRFVSFSFQSIEDGAETKHLNATGKEEPPHSLRRRRGACCEVGVGAPLLHPRCMHPCRISAAPRYHTLFLSI